MLGDIQPLQVAMLEDVYKGQHSKQPSIRQNTYNPIIYTMQLALRLKPETTGWLSTGYSNA